MTAPNVTSAPAPAATAVATESAPVQQTPAANEPRGLEAMIAKVSRNANLEQVNAKALAEIGGTPETISETPASATETLTAAITPNADGSTPPLAEATTPVMVGEIKLDDPDGEVVMRARDPKTGQFSEMDQTRTYELSLKDKTTGEERVYKKNLPEVLRLAKDGIAMQKAQGELQHYRANIPQWQQRDTQQQQRIQQLETLAQELLSGDEALVVARREAYAAELTPEKQIARREQALAQREQQIREYQARSVQESATRQATALASSIGPIVAEVEGLVGKEAAAGKLALALSPLMVNGVIPPERFPQVAAYVNGEYKSWAQAEGAKLTTARQQSEAQLAAARETQRKAQIAANQAGNAMRPMGGSPGAVSEIPQGKPRNVNDAIDRIIRRPVAAGA